VNESWNREVSPRKRTRDHEKMRPDLSDAHFVVHLTLENDIPALFRSLELVRQRHRVFTDRLAVSHIHRLEHTVARLRRHRLERAGCLASLSGVTTSH
jgi:hypothetical protein